MSRFTGSKSKISRRFGEPIFGRQKEVKRSTPPGQHGAKRRRKLSEYGQQLLEKQKAKYIYGMREKQFRIFFERAKAKKGKTGDLLLQMCESRLDNVVYRLGFGVSRPQARQIVRHGHILVNGKKVDIPSYLVSTGDVITIREKSAESEHFKALREGTGKVMPQWLTIDAAELKATVVAMPKREDVDLTIQENLIVELYSR